MSEHGPRDNFTSVTHPGRRRARVRATEACGIRFTGVRTFTSRTPAAGGASLRQAAGARGRVRRSRGSLWYQIHGSTHLYEQDPCPWWSNFTSVTQAGGGRARRSHGSLWYQIHGSTQLHEQVPPPPAGGFHERHSVSPSEIHGSAYDSLRHAGGHAGVRRRARRSRARRRRARRSRARKRRARSRRARRWRARRGFTGVCREFCFSYNITPEIS